MYPEIVDKTRQHLTSQSGVEIMISGGFQRRQVPTVSTESSREEEGILPDAEIKERF